MGRAAIFGERKFRQRLGNMLTGKQVDVLLYLWSFYEANDQLPPCEAVCAHFKYASPNAAYEHMKCLGRKGWIERNATGKWKFTALTREAMKEAADAIA